MRTFAQSRALNKERQRFYDAFAVLKRGETIEEFRFRLDGHDLVARRIEPYTDERREDFYLVATFMCLFGRGTERGPRIAPLCFKDTGNPYLYNSWGLDFGLGADRAAQAPHCPRKQIFGIVTGGVWDGERRVDP
jgi:hypothetical protein